MKKKLLPLVTVVALLTMPVSQAMAAPKPTPPAGNAGGQMNMSASQMASSQPAMSGWDMVKMRTTAKMRAKAARNAKLKGKPAQAVAASTFDAAKGPDYFGTTPNYASSPMPHIVLKGTTTPVVLPAYDPATNTLTDPATQLPVTAANSPFLADPADATGVTPLLDPINQIPQLDFAKVDITGGIRKFIEPLPGIDAPRTGSTVQNLDGAGANPTTAYVPTGTPDTSTYPGSDYYEIGLKEYYQQFSPDLAPTKLRGYYQINDQSADKHASRPFYLGVVINSTANRPVRVKFVNELPNGDAGNLPLPTDTTVMGSGTGPDGKTAYTQNRALIHLHGGLTPWISDGTPNQWTVPKGDTAKYAKGVSAIGVPDMPGIDKVNSDGSKTVASSDGALTYFYTNAQSARQLWYHDHTYGLTRLNVYAGEVSDYFINPKLTDPTQPPSATNPTDPTDPQAKLDAILPSDQVNMVIQDKGFVPDSDPSGYFPDGQLKDQDPTWDSAKWGGTGNLWFPHVYMTNQNPYDNSGAAAMGRWDYGPWFWPIFGTSAGLTHGEVANPYYDPTNAPWEPPMIPGTPSTYTKAQGLAASDVSLAPEAFVDTAVVNGVAYPYLNVDPKAYRFRILNGANDRYWNLQMYCSAADKPNGKGTGLYKLPNPAPMWSSTAKNAMPQNAAAGEVPMVPAVRTAGFPADWPTDGRDGGVPDPAASVGGFLQVGNEAGVLPNAVDVANQPVNYVYNRRDIIVLSISTHALLLGPAERADVVYDFSAAAAAGCQNVILYNDSPTPVPAFDPRNDYYSNNPDQTDGGGAPSTLPGYGPNTRTIMQFRINGVTSGTPLAAPAFDAAAVKAAVPATFAAEQPKPIVPETRYAAAYPGDPIGGSDVYSRIQSNDLTFTTTAQGDIKSLDIANAGSGYAPTATVTGGGTGAILVPVFDGTGQVTSVTVVNGGSGYSSNGANAAKIAIATPVGGTAATARPIVAGGVITGVTVNSGGRGYSAGATVTIDAPANGGTATADATVNLNTGVISALTLTDVGNGYAAAPGVRISAPLYAGIQATASSTLASGTSTVKLKADPKAIQELFEMDYGRMNATLGVELPFTNSTNQTTLPLGYTEPTTENLKPTNWGNSQIGTLRDGTAVWKVTHNGVDTHTIHFHLMDVQLINRVGWDGAIRPPDDNEMGWKESVRMNPLEDAIVAMRPVTPPLPFKIGDSIRSIDPTMPANHQMSSLDPITGQAITFSNAPVNMGWEYVWHCHLLGHEENDMMRVIDYKGSPDAPTIGTGTAGPNNGTTGAVTVKWTNNANWQLTNFVVQRSASATFAAGNVQTLSDKAPLTGGAYVDWQGNKTTLGGALGKATQFVDTLTDPAESGTTYYYRVRAESAQGYSQWSDPVRVKAPTFNINAPSAPVLGAVTNGDKQSSVVVTTPSVVTGGTFTSYQYRVGILGIYGGWTNFNPAVTNIAATPLVITGLTNGLGYTAQVRAVVTAGTTVAQSAQSNTVNLAPVAPPTPPAAPTNFRVTSTARSGGQPALALAWTGLSTFGNAGLNYTVQVTNTTTSAVQSVTVNGTLLTNVTTTLRNGANGLTLASGTTYSLQIRANKGTAPNVLSSAWAAATGTGTPA